MTEPKQNLLRVRHTITIDNTKLVVEGVIELGTIGGKQYTAAEVANIRQLADDRIAIDFKDGQKTIHDLFHKVRMTTTLIKGQ